MSLKITISVLMICACEFAFACTTIRLDLDPTILGRVPPASQGNTFGCYGTAAAQLIDAHRMSTGDASADSFTSGLALSVLTGNFAEEGSGSLLEALNFARHNGVCTTASVFQKMGEQRSEDFVRQMLNLYNEAKGRKGQTSPFFSEGNQMASGKGGVITGDAGGLNSQPINFIHNNRELTRKYSKLEKLAAEKCTLHITQAGMIAPPLQVVLNSLSKTQSQFVQDMIQHLCGRLESLKLPMPTMEDFTDPETKTPFAEGVRENFVKRSISKVLQSRKPVGIQFCNEVVTDSAHMGRFEQTLWGREYVCQQNGNHAAVIVGRQFNKKTKRCDYLVRDSFCDRYQKPKNAPSDFCVNKQYWISENDLAFNTHSIVHF